MMMKMEMCHPRDESLLMRLLEVVLSRSPSCLISLLDLCLGCVVLDKFFKLVMFGLSTLLAKFLVCKHLNSLFCGLLACWLVGFEMPWLC